MSTKQTPAELLERHGNAPVGTSRRRNHGRGHSYWIDDAKVPGITTALNVGYPKKALIEWAGKETAGYAVDNWEELGELPPSKRLERLNRARFDTKTEASVRGTEVHRYAQRLAGGEEVEPPVELVGHVDAYLEFVLDWQPVELAVERAVFSRRYRYAGTPDLIARLADGRVWLLDWKTSAKGVYLDNVLQLAAARFAEYVVEPDGREVPLAEAFPPIDAAGVVWLRADGYDLVPVEADERAFRVFLYVMNVAAYVDADRDDWIGDAIRPPERGADGAMIPLARDPAGEEREP